MSIQDLQDIISSSIAKTLYSRSSAEKADIFALSLYTDAGDVEYPELVFSVNTESQVARALRGETDAYGAPSGEEEARWNYAFWLQERNSRFLFPRESECALLWRATLRAQGLEYSEDEDFDMDSFEDTVVALLEDLAVRVARELHTSGVIHDVFGRDLPVVVHQLEYNDGTAEKTEAANPPNVADAFIRWVESL